MKGDKIDLCGGISGICIDLCKTSKIIIASLADDWLKRVGTYLDTGNDTY